MRMFVQLQSMRCLRFFFRLFDGYSLGATQEPSLPSGRHSESMDSKVQLLMAPPNPVLCVNSNNIGIQPFSKRINQELENALQKPLPQYHRNVPA
jgi:hypothetical protein